ncbi:MAG: hypothetical protein V1881_00895 [Candidatus Micrarchaeota archaeon]
MKKMLLVLLASVLLFGCAGQPPAPEASPTPTPTAVPTFAASPSPTPSFTALKLEYEFTAEVNGAPGKIVADYFFEDSRTCGGDKAWLGLLKSYAKGNEGTASWNKISATLNNGVGGYSQQLSRNELAFDTAHSYRNDFDIAFFMNFLFYAAGENFIGNTVWTKEEPTILKGVEVFGNAPNDYSIVKKGAGNGTIPCTEFEVLSKNSGMDYVVCVTEPSKENPLSYVVYFNTAGGNGVDWELKSVSSEKSGVTRVLQCIPPVLCGYVPMPSGDDRQACEAGGKKMQATSDERGCVLHYDCIAAGLKVTINAPDGSAVPNLEVDLWKKDSSGSPDWAVQTGADGVATFNVLPGEYKFGFNMNGWPQQYKFPGQGHAVTVPDGGIGSAEITLEAA